MKFETARQLFEHTLANADQARPDIHAAMLAMARRETIETANEMVSTALALDERVWMTSDLHFGHTNIISYCDRPFRDTRTMDLALSAQLGKVGDNELLLILGDVSLGDHEQSMRWVRRIPGRKILVAGNHDFMADGYCRLQQEKDLQGKPLFEAVVPFLYWDGPHGIGVLACHYPLQVPAHHKSLILNYHGHLHREVLRPTDTVKYMNVGWDVDYALKCL